jgi:hypothetical protein
VQPKIGLTFARVLKAMLRAAPNIILVGEIRTSRRRRRMQVLKDTSVLDPAHERRALTRRRLGSPSWWRPRCRPGAQRLVRRLCKDCAE